MLGEIEHSLGQSSQSETGSVQFHTEEKQQSQDNDCSEKSCDDDGHITESCNVHTDCFNLDRERDTSIMETRDMPNTEQPSQETGDRDTQGVEDTQERVSCVGRVAKNVSRLIESMAQRQLKIKSIANTLDRKSQSLLTLLYRVILLSRFISSDIDEQYSYDHKAINLV